MGHKMWNIPIDLLAALNKRNVYMLLFSFPAISAAAQSAADEAADAVTSSITTTTVVMAAVMSAIATVLVSALVVLTVRQVQQWRSSRNAPSDHSQFNGPARSFAGFGSVSSKLSAMTMGSIDSVTTEEA